MRRTPSGVGSMVQCPNLPISWWYDFQTNNMLLLVKADGVVWVIGERSKHKPVPPFLLYVYYLG